MGCSVRDQASVQPHIDGLLQLCGASGHDKLLLLLVCDWSGLVQVFVHAHMGVPALLHRGSREVVLTTTAIPVPCTSECLASSAAQAARAVPAAALHSPGPEQYHHPQPPST